MEAYKKWREEHPDSEEPDLYGSEGGEDEEDGESLLDDDESDKWETRHRLFPLIKQI